MKHSWLPLLLLLSACRRDAPPAPAAAAPAPASPAAPVRAGADSVASRQVERGRYLGEHVLACGSCHSARDWTRYGGPVTGAPLAGACWGEGWDLPGRVCAPNLTSDPEHGLGKWTDDELLRALRDGTGRDGKTLFPLMPFLLYRELSDADARAVIAWLRTVPPSTQTVPRSELPAEMYAEYQGLAAPQKAPVAEPAAEPVAQGRYLAQLAQCAACHAGVDEAATPFVGGRPLATPYGPEVVANLTPHATGLGSLDAERFVARFAAFRDVAPAASVRGHPNKLAMPWIFLAGMTEPDLRAVYQYLRTVPAMATPAPSAK
ncbi:cytochrome c [Corallococcus sp. M34]|uniref:c-type cytochrome n=1 Tax=Citreicoccus inhibens TaxID=2849499 RepID=UPI001C23620A|nr:cytochrome c [Citreicoccus inhibens]MBU8894123.1 cytochrome c [Citreicoccus inhibens]